MQQCGCLLQSATLCHIEDSLRAAFLPSAILPARRFRCFSHSGKTQLPGATNDVLFLQVDIVSQLNFRQTKRRSSQCNDKAEAKQSATPHRNPLAPLPNGHASPQACLRATRLRPHCRAASLYVAGNLAGSQACRQSVTGSTLLQILLTRHSFTCNMGPQ